ncbi:hypothetical protein [Nocardioides albertanoniae]|uniref:hypothetical protein n=1 Tax=Nocardioides albertanoniae TaxID=1175486 RepID=UPI00114D7A69|nr:hypothetical protein [Nocardioides albertanoniae]
MTWYLPIGVYEGVRSSSEIVDSTVDISSETASDHAVLRIGSGSLPLPTGYAALLEILSTAPAELALAEWVESSGNVDAVRTQLNELNENGLVMQFGNRPLTDDELADIQIRKVAETVPSKSQPEPFSASGGPALFEAGDSQGVAYGATLMAVSSMGSSPSSLAEILRAVTEAVPEEKKAFAEQILQGDLQHLVRHHRVELFVKE